MVGFLGKKCCGHFSITKHQYPKKPLQWICGAYGLVAWINFFFLISYYFGTLNRKMSCFLNISVFNSHIVASGGKQWLFI